MYGVLKEAEHRSTFYIPYWNLPLSGVLVPRLRRFRSNMAVINECLDGLIDAAKRTRREQDVEVLQAQDYSIVRAGAEGVKSRWGHGRPIEAGSKARAAAARVPPARCSSTALPPPHAQSRACP